VSVRGDCFRFGLGHGATAPGRKLRRAYGDSARSRARVPGWFKAWIEEPEGRSEMNVAAEVLPTADNDENTVRVRGSCPIRSGRDDRRTSRD